VTGGHLYDDYLVIFITQGQKGGSMYAAKGVHYDIVATLLLLAVAQPTRCLALPVAVNNACEHVHNVYKRAKISAANWPES
jgi:hypothetical protein